MKLKRVVDKEGTVHFHDAKTGKEVSSEAPPKEAKDKKKVEVPGIAFFLNFFGAIFIVLSGVLFFSTFPTFNFDLILYSISSFVIALMFFALAQIIYQLQQVIKKD